MEKKCARFLVFNLCPPFPCQVDAIFLVILQDIAGVLSSFAQKGARSFCILSAVGCVSIVDICPAGYFGSGILRFKA